MLHRMDVWSLGERKPIFTVLLQRLSARLLEKKIQINYFVSINMRALTSRATIQNHIEPHGVAAIT